MKTCIKNFDISKIYDISTGFCSVKYWTRKIERNVYELIQAIHIGTFTTASFNFKENYDKLIKKFRRMSLVPVCLLFLRCRRSCKKETNYCKIFSSVRGNNFNDYHKFSNFTVQSDGDYLDISSSDRIDLDVFLCKSKYFHCSDYKLLDGRCSHLEVISFAQDLFTAFSSVVIRMYLNYTLQHFSDLLSQIILSDEEKIIRKSF